MNFATFILKNLLRRKARSLLTMCGIAVAVATTIALLGVSDDFQSAVLQSFKNEGSDIVISPKGSLLQIAGDMNEAVADDIRKVPGVAAVSQGLLEQIAMEIDDNQVPVLLQGWKHGTFAFNDIEIIEGRSLEPDDVDAVMLGEALAEKMHAKVNQPIEIQDETFNVVGIYDSKTLLKRGAAIMLLRRLQDLMLREGSVTGFSVQVDPEIKADADAIEAVCERIDNLNDADGNSLNLDASSTDDYVRDNFQLKLTRAMAWVTSLIAVGVGTIGMLNTMIMSVMERIREISVLRAMGWRRGRVIAMIVGESIVLSIFGAALGAGVAIVGSHYITKMPQVNGFLSGHIAPWVLAAGMTIAFFVGLIGAAYPAWRASRLLPSEGLRYE
ncbi:Macrolide export ATP-binding/permease protein MacB [Rosistilla carotiformis]|uniref:Macrolide export ATP-binding/permease protein MacB n=1 Tax=Rosistilla carotiformis TaxID=2528017 RepID=A0A518JM12_9BACT|nr:ABC transporter permease [Rosistilla carotiformis]QDV66527.1 Macrolide export ATP-binding/permease protein MacB [Rosistilla carotiformis]